MTQAQRSESRKEHGVTVETLRAAAVLLGVTERTPLDREEIEASMLTVGQMMRRCQGDRAKQDQIGALLGWQDAIAEEAIIAGSDKRA